MDGEKDSTPRPEEGSTAPGAPGETPWSGLNELRDEARGRASATSAARLRPRVPLGPRLRRAAIWLLIAAIAVDIAAYVSYALDQRFFRRLASEILGGGNPTTQEILERFVEFAYLELERPTYDELPSPLIKLYYKLNPFHPSARDVVKYGCDYRGGCGSSSRVVLALLDAVGIPSRSLVLRDENGQRVHAVVNALIEGKWAVADPLYGIVFKRPDGELATAEELRDDPSLFESNVRQNPSYPRHLFTYDNFALLNWNKVPVLLPAVRWVLAHTIGERRTNSISRPRIWMYPFQAFALLITICAALAATAILLATRERRRGQSTRAGRPRGAPR